MGIVADADKRRSVQTLLADEEWSQKSDRWIAEKACVSQPTVTRLRAENTGDTKYHLPAKPTPKVAKDGKTYSFPDRKKKSDPPALTPEPPPSSSDRGACRFVVARLAPSPYHLGYMATSKQTTMRFTEDDLAMLDAIQRHAGVIGRADVVRFAIRECVRSLGIEVKRPKPAKT